MPLTLLSINAIPILIVVFGVLLVLAVVLNVHSSHKNIVRRQLKKTATQRMSAFKTGDYARIVGRVEPLDELMTAPLSKRKCVSYYSKAEQCVKAGNLSKWETIIEEEVTGKFLIRDGDHLACIDSGNLKTLLANNWYAKSGEDETSQTTENYLNAHGYEAKGFLGVSNQLRFVEAIILPGEQLTVVGKGEWKQASQLSLPESIGRVLYITARDNEPVYLSNDPEIV